MLQILGKTDKLRDEWTIRKVVDNYESGVSVFDNAVQRGLVWDIEKKSRLIRSTLLGRPIPPIYVSKHEEGGIMIHSNLDGKQRSFAWIDFLKDKYELKGLDPITVRDTETGDVNDIDINGKCFSELPEVLRNAITDATVTVIVINNATEDEECEIFYDINNGKPLNAITITRVKAKSRKTITELGSHELFKNALTQKALEKYTNEDIVVKTWAMLYEENPGLDTKYIRPLMQKIQITKEQKAEMEKCFDRILTTYNIAKDDDKKIAKRILTRTHMVSIMRVVKESIDKKVSDNHFANWFMHFYAGRKSATISDTYNSYAGAGSGKPTSVGKRLEVLDKDFHEYLAETMKER